MNQGITKSVGKGGANEKVDVKFVQTALNAHVNFHTYSLPMLKVDGIYGSKTLKAIEIFQKDYVQMKHPDGRIDPNGKTIRYLTMYVSPQAIKQAVAVPASNRKVEVKDTPLVHGLDEQIVSYESGVAQDVRLVSEYSKSVIKMALKEAGMTHAVISSTVRTPLKQAQAMYDNCVKNLADQYKMYRSSGALVIDVFVQGKKEGFSKEKIVKAMEDKIHEIHASGRLVSKHCLSIEMYSKRNVFDIGVNKTRLLSKRFDAKRFDNALNGLQKDGYISHLINELKSNNCWHIEIDQSGRFPSLVNQGMNYSSRIIRIV